uniref:Putative prophage protein (Ps3) n=1 Tax=Methanococcus maripaludis (strain C6 / ATCC BAA-1332) TaxID=444158 RepID=A9A7H7_METM6
MEDILSTECTQRTYTIFELANWFLSKSSMTHKKLQKLCYYAVAWHYALYDKQLISNDTFEAWVHGPVSRELYEKYRGYAWNPIGQRSEAPNFDADDNQYLEILYETYKHLDGHQLEARTHEELPWKEARKGLGELDPSNNIINPETMCNYYKMIYESSQSD